MISAMEVLSPTVFLYFVQVQLRRMMCSTVKMHL